VSLLVDDADLGVQFERVVGADLGTEPLATTSTSSGSRSVYPRTWMSRSSITLSIATWMRSARSGSSLTATMPRCARGIRP